MRSSRTGSLYLHLRLMALCAAILMATASAAFARSGTVNLTTYLRSGPGEKYAVLDEIEPRSKVDVRSCQGDWCQVASGGAEGYIKAAALSAPDLHAKPLGFAQTSACFTARLNGAPRSGDDVQVCGQ